MTTTSLEAGLTNTVEQVISETATSGDPVSRTLEVAGDREDTLEVRRIQDCIWVFVSLKDPGKENINPATHTLTSTVVDAMENSAYPLSKRGQKVINTTGTQSTEKVVQLAYQIE